MIYYLAQAYSNNPTEAHKNAVWWTYQLRLRNLAVLSPILHTHPYHVEVSTHPMDQVDPMMEWEQLKADQKAYLKREDYVQWDLAICAAMLVPEIRGISNGKVIVVPEVQPNLTMLFAPTCFTFDAEYFRNCDDIHDTLTFESSWASKGAKAEYEFAKKKNVKCLLLTEFFAGREVAL